METTFTFSPIGVLRSRCKFKSEQPRQGVFADNSGVIELNSGYNFEAALSDLTGFDYIWVLFVFHHNAHWLPKVSPPIAPGRKVGVFASRSPYRPNPIGMSCVRLTGIEGRTLHIANFDLLDGTPILDIKPYISEADAFPNAARGWLDEVEDIPAYSISRSERAETKIAFIEKNASLDFTAFCATQLSCAPTANARKRTSPLREPGVFAIGYRTWRIVFRLDEKARHIAIDDIQSSYSSDDLEAGAPDPYADKALHRDFTRLFNS